MRAVNNSETEQYNVFRLSGGLTCVHRRRMGAVSYIGIVVGAGSRDEGEALHGLAHFVEHTIFKGTRHRSSWHISNRMESIGGELNAYTSKEETVIYTAAPAGEPARALELVSDLVRYSTFPADELEREREVVCEEIKSYLDSPSDAVYDEFEELVYAGSPMAHNILGSTDSVHALTGADCRGFIEDFYTPDNMVLYVEDPSPLHAIERCTSRGAIPGGRRRRWLSRSQRSATEAASSHTRSWAHVSATATPTSVSPSSCSTITSAGRA